MSHNKITVAGQSPNSSGEITLSVENLSDVTISSASDTQVLKYNGSGWVNSAAPSTSTNYMLIGQGSGDLDLHHAISQQSMCATIIKIG